MFASTLGGRPLLMAQQVDVNKYTIQYDGLSVKNSYHLSLFILPNVEFDPNFTALIFYQFQVNSPGLSQPAVSTEFKLLGGLDAQKQSAIYKINPGNLGSLGSIVPAANPTFAEGEMDMDMDGPTPASGSGQTASIVLGISIEPNSTALPQLEQQKQQSTKNARLPVPTTTTPIQPTQQQVLEFSNKIIANAYNFLSSFTDNNNKVSIQRFNDWWTKFKSKMANDPQYLAKLQ